MHTHTHHIERQFVRLQRLGAPMVDSSHLVWRQPGLRVAGDRHFKTKPRQMLCAIQS